MICLRASSLWRSEVESSPEKRQRECIDVSGIYLGAVFTSTTSALWVFLIGTRKKSQFHFMRAFSTLMARRRSVGRRCRVHKWKEESEASCATCARDENEKSNRPDTRLVFWRWFEVSPNRSRSVMAAKHEPKVATNNCALNGIRLHLRCGVITNVIRIHLTSTRGIFLLGWLAAFVARLNNLRINSLEKWKHTKAAGSRIHHFGELGN